MLKRSIALLAALSAGLAGCTNWGSDKASLPPPPVLPGTQSASMFDTPQDAVAAMEKVLANGTAEDARKLFGTRASELLSGDPVQDAEDLATFRAAFARHHEIVSDGLNSNSQTLLVGPSRWAFPVPLVNRNGKWFWDTAAGILEVTNRRIGHNELGAISACRAYVEAQREYFAADRDGDGVLEYARSVRSEPGQRNGLFWESDNDDDASPLGPLLADASPGGQGMPYYGYRYRILEAQGPSASGGAKSYLDGDEMTGGFALIAFPAEYGKTAVMTFIVGPDGTVYEKDLGLGTDSSAKMLTAFDPDEGWTITED